MIVGKMFREVEIYQGLKLFKGSKYVMVKSVIDQINRLFPRSIEPTDEFEMFYNPVSVSNLEKDKKIFLFRSGGIGDVLFMQPLIRILREDFRAKIKVATSPMYGSTFDNDPNVDEVLSMPFLLDEMVESDFHLTFEGVIEDLNNSRAQNNHAVDLFLETAGLISGSIPPERKVPKIYASKKETSEANKFVSRTSGERKKIGIQIAASSPVRTYPLEKFIDIARELVGRNYTVYLFGGPNQANDTMYIKEIVGKNTVDLVEHGFSLRESMIVCSVMNLMIAPDSAFIHIAGAFGVPVVGIYGCFPSFVRMRYYKNAIGIDCGVTCAPSFVHGHSQCKKGNPPPCFSVISPKNVIDAVDHLLYGKHIKMEYPDYNSFQKGMPIKLLEGLTDGET